MFETLSIEVCPPPLVANDAGVVLVGGTRVPLETIVFAHKRGDSPALIAEQYPALPLEDIYATIAYYLGHTDAVEEYVRKRAVERAEIQSEAESRFNPAGIRARLESRVDEK